MNKWNEKNGSCCFILILFSFDFSFYFLLQAIYILNRYMLIMVSKNNTTWFCVLWWLPLIQTRELIMFSYQEIDIMMHVYKTLRLDFYSHFTEWKLFNFDKVAKGFLIWFERWLDFDFDHFNDLSGQGPQALPFTGFYCHLARHGFYKIERIKNKIFNKNIWSNLVACYSTSDFRQFQDPLPKSKKSDFAWMKIYIL